MMRHYAQPQPREDRNGGITGIQVEGYSWLTALPAKQISAEEMKNIANIVNGEQASIEKAHAEGIHVGSERFVVARIDDGNIYGRKVRLRPPNLPSEGGYFNRTEY